MSSGSNGLCLRNHLAAGWTSGFYWGTIRLSVNTRPPSPKFTTSSQNLGARPIHLASAPLLQQLSHLLKALKRKDTSICLVWMSQWPRISARPRLSNGRRGRHIHPSREEPILHSLDVPTQRLDRQLQRCTRWRCFRSFKPRCSPTRIPVRILPRSGT